MNDMEFAPRHRTTLTYDIAWLYCITLNYNGHKDWRMPTESEWVHKREIAASSFCDKDDRMHLKCPVQPVRTK